MTRLLLTASLLLFFTGFLMCNDEQYTVMAKNGLRLRKNPEIDSKILTSIPFGKTVLGQAMPFDVQQYYQSGELGGIDNNYKWTSEGLNGFWHGISYSARNINSTLTEVQLKLWDQQNLRLHADFNTPLIGLVTDVNQDGILDVIVKSHTMTESCGICWYKDLYISKNGNQITIKHASRSIACNCVT